MTETATMTRSATLSWHELPGFLAGLSRQDAASAGVSAILDCARESIDERDPPPLSLVALTVGALRDALLARPASEATRLAGRAPVTDPREEQIKSAPPADWALGGLVSISQRRVLEAVAARGGTRVDRDALAEDLALRRGWQKTVYSFVQNGYLRERSDRLLALTPRGRECLRNVRIRDAIVAGRGDSAEGVRCG